MSFVCLQIPHWPTGADSRRILTRPSRASGTSLPAGLLAITPHVMVETSGLIWTDARGLDIAEIAQQALALARGYDAEARAGAASTAVTAAVAATQSSAALTIVPPGEDAAFLAPLPLTALGPSPQLASALASVGILRCGEVGRLTQEAMEVRFGAEGVALWRLARADDQRRMFVSTPRACPSASLAWEDYVLRHAEHLLFVANRLLTTVCTELHHRGQAAHAMTLTLTLTDGTEREHELRVARQTANRAVWMRQLRLTLDRVQISDGVAGCAIQVDALGTPAAPQGDLFDRGFQTAHTVEDTLLRLEEDGAATIVEPIASAHPLPERRVHWETRPSAEMPPRTDHATSADALPPRMVLHTFTAPPRIEVIMAPRHHRSIPVQFRAPEQHDKSLLTATGPDYVSGNTEHGTSYARAYFTCLTSDGLVVLLFRDAPTGHWYWQGWWA